MQIHTQGDVRDYRTWMTVSEDDRNHIIFRIKAASDAHILLTDEVNDYTKGYELIIGGWDNSQSAIKIPPHSGGTIVIEVPTPDILSANEWRTFWVTYDHGLIETGSGSDVGANIILQYHVDNPMTITAISVSGAVNYEADWEFSQFEG